MKLEAFKKEFMEWSRGAHASKTQAANDLALRKLIDQIGDVELSEIGARHVDRFMSSCTASGLKASSTNNYYRHLKAAFSKALNWEIVKANPFSKIKPLRLERVPPKFIPKDELAAFIAGIKSFEARMVITAYLCTGRRRGELLSLTWSDINMEDRKYRVNSTKAHLVKDFPINDMFYQVLAKIITKRGNDEGKVFPFWKPDSMTHMAKRELIKAGYPDFRLHSLRHSFASAYLQSGGDLFALKELLGHSQIQTTQVYSHLTDSHLKEEADKVRF